MQQCIWLRWKLAGVCHILRMEQWSENQIPDSGGDDGDGDGGDGDGGGDDDSEKGVDRMHAVWDISVIL